MKKIILILAIGLTMFSCNQRNCETCITEESDNSTTTPKTGVVTKIMLNSHSESSQDFIIYFEDEDGDGHNYESKTLAFPGDTITWY